jgi:hypothetical protein
MLDERAQFEELMSDIRSGVDPVQAVSKRLNTIDEGYSSIEVPEKQSAAEQSVETSEPEAAEPDYEDKK